MTDHLEVTAAGAAILADATVRVADGRAPTYQIALQQATAARDAISTFSDAELGRMVDRAYRDAARSWAEYRAETDARARVMLGDSAESAEEYWRHLSVERRRREAARS